MTRTIDFDKFRSEQQDPPEPVVLRLGGKEYDLPASLPAALALDIVRLQATKGDDADFSENDVQRLGSALFGGEERFTRILADGAVTIEEMPELIQQVLAMYGSGGSNAGNREARRKRAPRKTTSTSSRTGRSSKRTS